MTSYLYDTSIVFADGTRYDMIYDKLDEHIEDGYNNDCRHKLLASTTPVTLKIVDEVVEYASGPELIRAAEQLIMGSFWCDVKQTLKKLRSSP